MSLIRFEVRTIITVVQNPNHKYVLSTGFTSQNIYFDLFRVWSMMCHLTIYDFGNLPMMVNITRKTAHTAMAGSCPSYGGWSHSKTHHLR